MKRLLAATTVALMTVALVSSLAIASPTFTQATGSISMSPSQFAAFNAFDYGVSGDRGTVNYTNFDYPAPGSGVWLPVVGTYPLTTYVGASPYLHTMVIDSVSPMSLKVTTFSGTGFYVADPTVTWTVNGAVTGSGIWFDIVYTGTYAPYSFHAVGTIAADGSMSGTGTDSNATADESWTLPSGFAHEVLSYSASVTCAAVNAAHNAMTFVFTIPAGFPGLSGLSIVAKVVDGGTPGINGDTWAHGEAVSACDGPTVAYPITGGNLVVH